MSKYTKDVPKEKCWSCGGSGKYHGHGAVVNGKFTGYVGTCYRCNGKGWQTKADEKRNEYYDNHVRRIPQ